MSAIKSAVFDWLRLVSASEAPPDDLVAFNIGISEERSHYLVYLIGSATYDPADDNWACRNVKQLPNGQLSIPKQRKRSSPWEAVQKAVCDAAREFLATDEGAKSFLGVRKVVTVGFDNELLIVVSRTR